MKNDQISRLVCYLPIVSMAFTPIIFSLSLPYGVEYAKYIWLVSCALGCIPFLILAIQKRHFAIDLIDLLLIIFVLIPLSVDSTEKKYIIGITSEKYLTWAATVLIYLSSKNSLKALLPTKTFLPAFQVIILSIILIAVAISILQYLNIAPPFNNTFPITSTFFHPAIYAGYLAATAPFVVSVFIHSGTQNRYIQNFAKVTFIILATTLIALNNRASILGLMAGLFAILSLTHKNQIKTIVKVQSSRIVQLLVCVTSISTIGYLLYSLRPESGNGRLLVWRIAAPIIDGKILFGNGFDSFKYLYPIRQINYFRDSKQISPGEALASSEVSFAFNEVLQVLIENGLIGALCLAAGVMLLLWKSSRALAKKQDFARMDYAYIGAIGAIISILTYSFFSYPFSNASLTSTFLLFMAVAGNNVNIQNLPASRTLSMVLILLLMIAILPSLKPEYDRLNASRKWHTANIEHEPSKTTTYDSLYQKSILKNDPRFLTQYASVLLTSNTFEKAKPILEEKLKVRLSYDDLIKFGICLEKTGYCDQALDTYWQAYFLLPHKFLPLYKIMEINQANGKLAEARQVAKIILEKKIKVLSPEVLKIRSAARSISI